MTMFWPLTRTKTNIHLSKWVYEKLSLFNDKESGNVAIHLIKDIQREDEAKYNQEESMTGYSLLFDNNPSPMMIYDLATLRILKVNASAIETYGYTREEFLAMTLSDLRPDATLKMPKNTARMAYSTVLISCESITPKAVRVFM